MTVEQAVENPAIDLYRHIFVPAAEPTRTPLLLLHRTGGNEADLIPLARRISPGSAILAIR